MHDIILAAKIETPFDGLIATLIWIGAVVLGVYEYGRTKGRVGRAVTVTLGGGLLATFLVYPELLTTTLPAKFSDVIVWAVSLIKIP
ncbi:hypothetical protein AB0H83_36185 [Dactylosporangium sp. NPDC050688]|uniref:hypothetical protein n=1 Tax=Dactylosporangium sp. NPDC050688 TaxID=3157217 RepID=UPI0033D279A4